MELKILLFLFIVFFIINLLIVVSVVASVLAFCIFFVLVVVVSVVFVLNLVISFWFILVVKFCGLRYEWKKLLEILIMLFFWSTSDVFKSIVFVFFVVFLYVLMMRLMWLFECGIVVVVLDEIY